MKTQRADFHNNEIWYEPDGSDETEDGAAIMYVLLIFLTISHQAQFIFSFFFRKQTRDEVLLIILFFYSLSSAALDSTGLVGILRQKA